MIKRKGESQGKAFIDDAVSAPANAPVTLRLSQCRSGDDRPARALLPARIPLPASQVPARRRPEAPAVPMRWSGANARGNLVFGVAASQAEPGQVEILTVAPAQGGTPGPVRRGLSPQQSRQLARHLLAAADEAERCEALQLVATA